MTFLALLARACIVLVAASFGVRAETVTVSPGASIQAAIDAHPPGTKLILPAGTWRKQVIRPKLGNQLIGDPRGGTILTGEDVTAALYSTGSVEILDVLLKHLTVEHYGVDRPECHIGAVHGASRWRFEHTIFRMNNCSGLGAFLGSTIIGGQFVDNKHAGIKGDGSLTIRGAEIARNNTRRDSMTNDAAGVKLVAGGRGAQLLYNWVHDNHGTGLWCDNACEGGVIDGNTVVRNAYAGIMFEISSGVVIRNNVVNDNANMQIFISSSGEAEIRANNIRVPASAAHGILVQADPRANAVTTQNVVIHHNSVTFKGPSVRGSGTGLRSYGGPVGAGNSSDRNAFFSDSGRHWYWLRPEVLNWQTYRSSRRQDTNSSLSAGDGSISGCQEISCTGSGAVAARP
jgi:parallel beta-helix repeat protein